jgi:catechol 2,3-dioxygenase-like lactoylglutathione lyase family enzyme
MSYRLGQLIDHIGIRVSDYAAACRFYLALFKALDLGDQVGEGPEGLDLDKLYIGPAWQGGLVTRGLHLACETIIQAISRLFCSIRTETTSR